MGKIHWYEHSNTMVFIDQMKNALGALSLKSIKNEHAFALRDPNWLCLTWQTEK